MVTITGIPAVIVTLGPAGFTFNPLFPLFKLGEFMTKFINTAINIGIISVATAVLELIKLLTHTLYLAVNLVKTVISAIIITIAT